MILTQQMRLVRDSNILTSDPGALAGPGLVLCLNHYLQETQPLRMCRTQHRVTRFGSGLELARLGEQTVEVVRNVSVSGLMVFGTWIVHMERVPVEQSQ